MADTSPTHSEAPVENNPPRGTFERSLEIAVQDVREELGLGLTEAIYRNALAIELRNPCHGYTVSCEVPVPVEYAGEVIGMIRADIVAHDNGASRIIELKVAAKITEAHMTQANAYLARAVAGSSAYVINFGPVQTELRAVLPEVRKRKSI